MRHAVFVTWVVLSVLALPGCTHIFAGNRNPQIQSFVANDQVAVLTGGGYAATVASAIAPMTVVAGNRVVMVCRAADGDNDALSYSWAGDNVTPPTEPSNSYTWTAPATEGRYSVTCIISDGRGGTAQASVQIQVVKAGNQSPTAQLLGATTAAVGAAVQYTCTASDPEGQSLTYTFVATGGQVTANASQPNQATYTAPAQAGEQTLYCIVSDGNGGYGVAVAKVAVK